MNKIITRFNTSVKYYLKIISWTILSAFIVYSIDLSNKSFYLYLLIIAIYLTVLIYHFAGIRKKELDEIQSIIASIRLNKFESNKSIKLNTNLKKLEVEICSMYEKMQNDINYLKKLEKMRTQFLANVSHELRTPIFKVQGYIETLLDGAINDEKVNLNFLNKAKNSAVYLGNLINDLIDISMIESGEMKMSFRYFNLKEFISSIINQFKDSIEKKNLNLKFDSTKEGLKVYGDKERLKVVLNNLIQNAIKYTDNGLIEISLKETAENVIISVKDSGIGIPSTDLNRIFERFYRTETALSRAESGTGLGLAIVKHIVEAHNSIINVKSTLCKGSEFSFILKK